MTKQQKLELVGKAYVIAQKPDAEIYIRNDALSKKEQQPFIDIQYTLGVDLSESYNIMAEACDIVSGKTLEELESDKLDLYADADSQANVYTSVQLSYLNVGNEAEISELMKDEAITSIAQACAVWRVQKVTEACEALKDYILDDCDLGLNGLYCCKHAKKHY